jgi:ankyrin repeat protein
MAYNNPFLLAAENSPTLLPLLRSNTSLASKQDEHGYSLLHAAASYNHIELLRALVNEFQVNINLKDEDGETCLFVAETLPIAQCLVEELHIDAEVRNDEGITAMEKIAQEGDFPELAAYLRTVSGELTDGDSRTREVVGGSSNRPLPLPPNVTVGIGTMTDQLLNGEAQEPDPEFKRRIEELAAKDNFHEEEGQRELRDLITDAVRDVGENRDVRRRLD